MTILVLAVGVWLTAMAAATPDRARRKASRQSGNPRATRRAYTQEAHA